MGFIFFNRVRETMKITSILKRYTLLWWERAPASSWMCCHCLYLYIQVNGCSLAIWGHTVVNRSVLCAFSRVRLVLQVFLIEHKDNTAAMSVFIFWLTNNIKKTLKKNYLRFMTGFCFVFVFFFSKCFCIIIITVYSRARILRGDAHKRKSRAGLLQVSCRGR